MVDEIDAYSAVVVDLALGLAVVSMINEIDALGVVS